MLEFRSRYIAAGGNRHPSAADWDARTGLLAFGADRNVALWEPLSSEQVGIKCLLSGHTDTVNVVKFFPASAADPHVILSGSVDRTIRVWRVFQWGTETIAVLTGHTSSINCIAVHPESKILASGAADGTVKIWQLIFDNGCAHTNDLQAIQLKPRLFPLALALHPLGSRGDLLLAIAGTKGIIQIYVSSKQGAFEHQVTLTGHEGWIRSLSITRVGTSVDSDLLISSASQDKYIRLWRISATHPNGASDQNGLVGTFEESLSNKRHKLKGSDEVFLLTFEALLLGHEDWIYTVSWRLTSGKLQLLSTSADNSVAIWEAEESSGIWVITTKLGEISAQKGSTTATGSTGGFWIGLWSPGGDCVVSLSRTGSWRLWRQAQEDSRWRQGIGISGHVKAVTDIAWSKNRAYLLSTGSDQTTRLHAQWKRCARTSWHEMARPQIHGYDLNCIDSIGDSQFISGADEKLLRVFDEPRSTAELLHDLCTITMPNAQDLPVAASIPVLGLSNKILESGECDKAALNGGFDGEAAPSVETNLSNSDREFQPPHEDRLARQTLWPEREKLYGHGYEIFAVAASHDGNIVATSCKASSLDHAVIRIYTTNDWREVKPSLVAHSLTVTSLAFSKDDQYLLSVGRDRQWTIFEGSASAPDSYSLKHSNPRGHSRMILDACWASTGSEAMFVTAGRDKLIKIWKLSQEDVECVASMTASSAVTSIDVAPNLVNGSLLMASGEESGRLLVYAVDPGTFITKSTSVPKAFDLPSNAISRLRWRPAVESGERLDLAVASEDSSLRVFAISETS